mmetsp:Transcript_14619/g.47625  ORF Transcript_14619/g.47625 Transcript_14619/m.47625 type:complete len:80 (+) Transcript_14619:782-1021(+)|eukprot:CAMPEP_0118920568 /NCGR_PEP_ID=MMETSP1166-20130328/19133_1 /TAXON_ID=1104430 /ORGANISM="Chrysoreinhardia sp, Strain CCMP3193" /LENGTH=79 /DNA_ID=CAMNT_0006861107 /DNA_START=482 /DNA_END=721 /DNA_ORIENTATION=+
MRFEEEQSHPANAGLDKAVKWLDPIKKKYGDALSYGDLYTLAGVTAIKHAPVWKARSICLWNFSHYVFFDDLFLDRRTF